MPIDPDKYIVFKRDELFGTIGMTPLIRAKLDELTLKDAVVIRKQDKVAAAGLAAYANTMITVSEVIEDADQAKVLLEIADYFAGQADEARATCTSKLPSL